MKQLQMQRGTRQDPGHYPRLWQFSRNVEERMSFSTFSGLGLLDVHVVVSDKG